MSISIAKPTVTEEAKRTHNLYDNYDNLISVVKYDNNNNVEYVLKTNSTASGQAAETKKYQQVQVDINSSAIDLTAESATLRARIYKNETSKVYATGFIYWIGDSRESVLGKPEVINNFSTPSVFKGNFAYNISNLQDNTTYNYRAFVRHEYGTNYSPVAQFTTLNFTSIFSIVGQRYSGPAPFTATLSAVNAGFGDYTYAWNMTGGPIRFEYSLNSINIILSGAGYTPKATNYSLDSVLVTASGFGYPSRPNVLVNGTWYNNLTANLQPQANSFGISSVSVPFPLSGFQSNTFVITFSSSNDSSIVTVASGIGTPGTYEIDRSTVVVVDGTQRPTLVANIGRDEDTGVYGVSSVSFTLGPLTGFNTSARTVQISSNGPVEQAATFNLGTSIQYKDTDYLTRVVTHTYLSGGTYTAKCYAILNGDQIEKDAIRVIRVTVGADFTPQWSNILNLYGDNIAAAYDFRQWASSINLNEYPVGLWNFEPDNVSIASSYFGQVMAGQYFIDSTNPFSEEQVGGYFFIRGQSIPQIGGYQPQNLGGYIVDNLFGPGLNNRRAARFDPLQVGGYSQSWQSSNAIYAFNNRQPFTLSMWVNMNQFEAPGTKLLSVGPQVDWWNNKEFGITQSPSKLEIFKNIPLSESFIPFEPFAGYSTGFPVLTTSDPSKMLTPNTWNHIVITRGPSNNYKYYKNGTLALSGTGHLGGGGYGFTFNDLPDYQPPWNNLAGYCWMNIGGPRYYRTFSAPPSGLIDSVGLWAKEFSSTDVEDLYSGGTGTYEIGYLNPIVGPNLWLGGLVGSSRQGSIGPIYTRPETTGDPYWDNVSLLIKGNGTDASLNITDSSSYNEPLSSSGARISTAIKRFDTGSVRFSGGPVMGYIQTLSTSEWGLFGRGDFTVEWWEYIDPSVGMNYGSEPVDTAYEPVIFYGNPGMNIDSQTQMSPSFGIYYSRQTMFIVESNSSTGTYRYGFNRPSYADGQQHSGQWRHMVVQRRTAGTWYDYYYEVFVNGQLYTRFTGSISLPTNILIGGYGIDSLPSTSFWNQISGVRGTGSIGGAFMIGGYGGNPWREFPGYIDELRVTKGVARYLATFNPIISAFPTQYGTNVGTSFAVGGYCGSYAVTKATVPVTVPHTMVFVGKTNAAQSNFTTYQNIQPFKYFINTDAQRFTLEAYPWSGVKPAPQFGFQPLAGYTIPGNSLRGAYTPTGLGGYGNEWMYLACSFLGPNQGNQVRYYLKTPTISGAGIVSGYPNSVGFNGFPMFGAGGPSSPAGGYGNINGVVRLGMHLNRSFDADGMISLFKAITAGPAADIQL